MIDGRGRLFSTSILLLVVKKRSPDVYGERGLDYIITQHRSYTVMLGTSLGEFHPFGTLLATDTVFLEYQCFG